MNVRLQYTIPFTAGVHYHGRLIMNTYLFKAFMVTNVLEAEITNIAFERLKYFITDEMDSTVFINNSDTDACRRYIDAGIKITPLPNEPVDQIVGVMLFYKLNAIMEDRISIIETELSSHLGDNMIYIHSENEVTNDLKIPDWWTSADTVHCDSELINTDKVLPMIKSSAIWRDLNLQWPGEDAESSNNTIVFADFGKDETR